MEGKWPPKVEVKLEWNRRKTRPGESPCDLVIKHFSESSIFQGKDGLEKCNLSISVDERAAALHLAPSGPFGQQNAFVVGLS